MAGAAIRRGPPRVAEVRARLARLSEVFDLDRLAACDTGAEAVRRYYRVCRHAYTRFNHAGDSLHVGLTPAGRYEPGDMYAQPRAVAALLAEGPARVLELATGRGVNAGWLAARRPDIAVDGVDLSEVQLRYAARVAARHPSYRPRLGDFHDLGWLPDGSVDLAFVVDALCYSPDKARVLAEVARVLRPGGRFVVFDGYREREAEDLSPEEDCAARLNARGMALPDFAQISEMRRLVGDSPLALEIDEDLTEQVLPSVDRFERLAARFLRRRGLARALVALLPRALTANAVSGYLFPVLLETRIACYRLLVLRKPG